jgi:hypothetical protein
MQLQYWIILWKIVLVGGVGLFGGMAIWVTIGGFYDIKRLFARMAEERKQEEK